MFYFVVFQSGLEYRLASASCAVVRSSPQFSLYFMQLSLIFSISLFLVHIKLSRSSSFRLSRLLAVFLSFRNGCCFIIHTLSSLIRSFARVSRISHLHLAPSSQTMLRSVGVMKFSPNAKAISVPLYSVMLVILIPLWHGIHWNFNPWRITLHFIFFYFIKILFNNNSIL